jgi:prepilin-type N-terminal cleavage/methylation domain-containing protein
MKRTRKQQGVTLVELLVVMVIMSIVTTMIIITWIALQNSYAFTVDSTNQRVAARDTMARMVRELRDAQGSVTDSAIISATANRVDFMTTFNDPGGADNTGVNRLTRYQYVPSAETDPSAETITRTRDTNNDGIIGPGDRTTVLVHNVVNSSAPDEYGNPPVFSYDYYDANGDLQLALTDPPDPSAIVSVHIRVLVDLQPGHSPQLMDLTSTAQLRNMRQM